ncbi:MAG TPA: nucleoside-diphosphate kinase [Ktedonobacterales bacterium]|jgi:nucleoside-diphosphate kinase|nr:nucleoside-diphosphate kinase [Ktedonobacterales bacterium]
MERTLIIVKPEGVQRALVGQLLARFEARGMKLVGLKLMTIARDLAERHYAEHQGKPFYPGLVEHITSSPVVVGVLEGPNAIAVTRTMMGPTKPADAAPGTIRGDYALDMGLNILHGSDGKEAAAREIALFFGASELVSYERATDRWIAAE